MRSTKVVQLFHHHPSGRVLTFSFSKFIFFYLRLNSSLSLTTAFCETKCSLSKLNIKAESIIQKAFRKKELDMHVIIVVQQKKLPFTEHALTNTKRYLEAEVTKNVKFV